MTNRKTTKRALLGSVLALVLCFAMLLGSTYAWFTDTDSVDVAVIKSGTLDMEFSVYQNDDWTTEPEDLFAIPANEWWEPGYAQVEYFMIENVGNLALQWQARIGVTEGVELQEDLAENITVYVAAVTYDDIEKADERADVKAWTNAGSLADFVDNTQANNSTIKGILAPTDESSVANADEDVQYFAIALVMNEDAGNDCQGKTLLENGTMTLTIVATQTTAEADDFGTDYDTININDMPIANFTKYPAVNP